VSSTASSQSAARKAKRPKKEISKDDTEALEADPVFEIPQEMQQMLQTFSRELNVKLLYCS